MPILNYTTKIAAAKTVGEIIEKLTAAGAGAIMTQNDPVLRIPVSVSFTIATAQGEKEFRLPCNYEGVLKVLQKEKKLKPYQRTPEQALRVAWRIVKDWIEAQLAIIEAGMVSVDEVFMPYLLMKSGNTLYVEAKASGMKLLN